jgi:hypothetical protein
LTQWYFEKDFLILKNQNFGKLILNNKQSNVVASGCLCSAAAMLRLINFDILSLETSIKPKDMHQDAPQITS